MRQWAIRNWFKGLHPRKRGLIIVIGSALVFGLLVQSGIFSSILRPFINKGGRLNAYLMLLDAIPIVVFMLGLIELVSGRKYGEVFDAMSRLSTWRQLGVLFCIFTVVFVSIVLIYKLFF